MTKKEKIADLKKRIAEWDRKRLGMEGLRLLKFELAELDRNIPLHDQSLEEGFMRKRRDFDHFSQGDLRERWENYRQFSDDGKGNDIITGKPLKTFEEWLGI